MTWHGQSRYPGRMSVRALLAWPGLHIALVFLTGYLLVWGEPGETSAPLRSSAELPAGLRQAYLQFLRLPSDHQQRLLALHRALREEDPATQTRLLRLMVRYGEWLDRLASGDRVWLDQVGSDKEKLERIRAIKERQWIQTLPLADREALAKARQRSEKEFQELLKQIRDRERQLDLQWNLAAPPSLDQEQVRAIVAEWFNQLSPKVTQQQRQLLLEAQKRNQRSFLFLLAELSEKHDVPVPQELHRLRLIYPPVSQRELWRFLRNELDPSAQEEFELRFSRPGDRDLAIADLVRAYWQAHPKELHKLRQRELRQLGGKSKPQK